MSKEHDAVRRYLASHHERKCWDCDNVAMHTDSITPAVICKKCGSQDTRRTDPAWVLRLERGNADMREFVTENIAFNVRELLIYKRAMESMAEQFVHPKTSAWEMACIQLGLNRPTDRRPD